VGQCRKHTIGIVGGLRRNALEFWLYRIWCGGILQICGDGSQFAVLLRLNDRKLSQSGLESLSIVCRRSILMLFSHN
jgi:hypothetical protein